MKLAIVSDIHGNIVGMKAVVQAINSLGGVDKLVVAGDVVTASSGNTDLMQLLFENRSDIIRGNAESFLADPEGNIENVPPRFRQYMTNWREWLQKQLAQDEWTALTQSPLVRRYQFSNGKSILVCHASPRSEWDRICGPQVSEQLLSEVYGAYKDDMIVYGHYHSHHVISLKDKILVNVASVGLRKDGLSCFTIIEDGIERIVVRQYTVPYDVNEELQLNQESGAPVFD